ncbi:hypothetical protein L4174_008370 [Photobacterium sp. CCB-ST2H9]|uniref:hypothetical protein n=1 Tax=Photobacterium sp. CCB-ST2H9 TaxID=2912855 RepID=UPI0020040009|nr:hypothetical protein [Photobacterium sp. CCB-ST2H9]UTM58830.1 hypothetical protein L4174_008370 [Photobacterium sp. CCB-ST2H9]
MSTIVWNDGRSIALTKGDTATCEALKSGQLYAVFLYNAAGEDQDIPVNVNIGNGFPPKTVTVPGTTGNNGLAALALISGTDTQTVSISITSQQSGAKVDAWIGSVGMPTNTSGIENMQLPFNGETRSYGSRDRYYAVPESRWYQLTINSPQNQFISVQFTENQAKVFINNPVGDPGNVIVPTGTVAEGSSYEIVKPKGQPQTITYDDQGNGRQKVWMNADSQQNSSDSTIVAQYL